VGKSEWTVGIGLRNATISLLWRSVIAGGLWAGLLWAAGAFLDLIESERIPMLLVMVFSVAAGTAIGITLSH